MEKEKLTYTQAMERLEHIVSEIENNQTDIDQICDKIKEAQSLIKFCQEKLYKTDRDVSQLLNNEDKK